MTREIASAQLSIVDGSWQEVPSTLVRFSESQTRGTLYVSVEVIGDAADRDLLAQRMIDTAHREYAASHGSLTLALAQAVRAVNSFFYDHNLNAPRELRCIAGITAAALRGDDLFIAQGGPGVVVHTRDGELTRFPKVSPWFSANEPIGVFPTPGAVPVGLRRDYTPDLSYIRIQDGDTILLATRALVQLFSDEELRDAIENRSAAAIVESLEEMTGSADLSILAIQARVREMDQKPEFATEELKPSTFGTWFQKMRALDRPTPVLEEAEPEITVEPPPPAPTEEELEAIRLREERKRARRARITAGILGAGSLATRGLAGIGSRVDTGRMGTAVEGALARALIFVLSIVRAAFPGAPPEQRGVTKPEASSAWRLAGTIFPILVLALGGWTWFQYQRQVERALDLQFTQLIDQSTAALKNAEALSKTDKNSARANAERALGLANEARTLRPEHIQARSAALQAQDTLDRINGIEVLLYVPTFANFSDPKARPARIALRYPDIFVLDRGTNRVHHYKMDEAGTTVHPVGEAAILAGGVRTNERIPGELIDLTWIEAGRLAVIDRTGVFWQYSPGTQSWTVRPANDSSLWARATLAASYLNRLYLLNPARNQILRYVPVADAWTTSTTYFSPGVTPDLSNTVDLAVDADVWVLRQDGSVLRFAEGKHVEFVLRELEIPLKNPSGIFVAGGSLYIADSGNQRVVQFERASGKFMRQFKPGGDFRASFDALRVLAVDEAQKKIFVLSGTLGVWSNIPQ